MEDRDSTAYITPNDIMELVADYGYHFYRFNQEFFALEHRKTGEKIMLKYRVSAVGALTFTAVGDHCFTAVECDTCGHKWTAFHLRVVEVQILECGKCGSEKAKERKFDHYAGRGVVKA